MKKNITINLFGSLYAIDEDAYELLNRYLESMKSYFSRQEGGEEIADDIEHRVAELLWQAKANGTEAVNIEIVRDIIGKIGNPTEIDNQSENADNDSARKTTEDGETVTEEAQTKRNDIIGWLQERWQRLQGRYLYRDPNDKVLGGVLAGMSLFFESGTPLLWRLGFILLVLIPLPFGDSVNFATGPFLVIAYITMWCLVPLPQTPEDKLRMSGNSVTPENIKKTIINESTAQEKPVNTGTNNARGCLSILLKFFLVLALLPFIGIFAFMVFAFFFVVTGMFGIMSSIFPFWSTGSFGWVPGFIDDFSWMFLLGLLCIFYVVGLPIYLIIRAIRNNSKRMRTGAVVTYALTWIISLIIAILLLISTAMNIGIQSREWRHLQRVQQQVQTALLAQEELQADTIAIDTVGWRE